MTDVQRIVAEKLLPCPFCGSAFRIGQEPHDNHPVAGMFYIYHDYGPLGSAARRCIINVPKHFGTKDEAIAAWNIRPAGHSGEIVADARELADAEAAYRKAHDLHGDGSPEAGRAWDVMRRAGDRLRAAVLAGPAVGDDFVVVPREPSDVLLDFLEMNLLSDEDGEALWRDILDLIKQVSPAAPTPQSWQPEWWSWQPDTILTKPDGDKCAAIFAFVPEGTNMCELALAHGFIAMPIMMDDDDPCYEAYSNGTLRVGAWQPEVPEGWTYGIKYDSEEGPIFLVLRRLPTPPVEGK